MAMKTANIMPIIPEKVKINVTFTSFLWVESNSTFLYNEWKMVPENPDAIWENNNTGMMIRGSKPNIIMIGVSNP